MNQKITATEFKARCLELMDRVSERGETYFITKRGRQVAKLAPIDVPKRSAGVLGCLRGHLEIAGEIVTSPAAEQDWHATLREWDELNAKVAGRRPRRR
jgi:prevent-host-death family protein